MARTHEECSAADRPTDEPLVDALAGGLLAAAEEGVGRGADPQDPGRGRIDEGARFGERDAKRLFRVDVLAGADRLQADFDMRLRAGEIENDLDRRIREHGIDGARGEAKFGRARFRRRGVGVGQGDDVEDGEFSRGGQIGRADVAAADDADPDPFHHEFPATQVRGSRMGAGPVVPQGAT